MMSAEVITAIGSVAGVVAVVVAFLSLWPAWKSWRLSSAKPRLVHEMLATISLKDVAAGFPDEVQISYQGEALRDDHYVVDIRLENVGSNIAAEDIHRPISITFPSGIIRTASIMSTRPDNLYSEVEAVAIISEHVLEIPRTLLNSGDVIDIRAHVVGETMYHPNARILGLKAIEKRVPRNENRGLTEAGFVVLAIALTLTGFALERIYRASQTNFDTIDWSSAEALMGGASALASIAAGMFCAFIFVLLMNKYLIPFLEERKQRRRVRRAS